MDKLNTIKVYGYIFDAKLNEPIENCTIEINSNHDQKKSISNIDGYWEVYIYPDKYTFKFTKDRFNNEQIEVQFNDEHTELQFKNITLKNKHDNGMGLYLITDKCINKIGRPLENLLVEIINIDENFKKEGDTITNDEGKWTYFLNPGTYLIEINGEMLSNTNLLIVNIDKDGQYNFENIDNDYNYINNGPSDGVELSDQVLNNFSDPISNVRIRAYDNNTNQIIAESYTNKRGKWTLNLYHGLYKIEYYHSKFSIFSEIVEITNDNNILWKDRGENNEQ
ncbi:MAG: hypothetical protein ACOCRK_01365 [bacterium]